MELATSEPSRVGRYELLFRIASGGMAEVYAARMTGAAGFQKLAAVKRMLPSLADDDAFVQMFLDEARLAAHIDSPHCVSTLDLGRSEDGALYIVMELVVGVTASRLIGWAARQRCPVPLGVALEVIAQAAHGLHDAHEAKTPLGEPLHLVHRDISPQNILVGVDGRARITDFGVARAVQRVTQTEAGRIKGKLGYAAPEQLRSGDVDRRADVFSLGVVAWELLAGQRLFGGETPFESARKVCEMPIPPLTRGDVPSEVLDVIHSALEKAPRDRLATARQLAERLREVAAQRGIGLATRDEVGRFVEQAGGSVLAKIRRNIQEAFKARDASFEPVPLASDAGWTPPVATDVERPAAGSHARSVDAVAIEDIGGEGRGRPRSATGVSPSFDSVPQSDHERTERRGAIPRSWGFLLAGALAVLIGTAAAVLIPQGSPPPQSSTVQAAPAPGTPPRATWMDQAMPTGDESQPAHEAAFAAEADAPPPTDDAEGAAPIGQPSDTLDAPAMSQRPSRLSRSRRRPRARSNVGLPMRPETEDSAPQNVTPASAPVRPTGLAGVDAFDRGVSR